MPKLAQLYHWFESKYNRNRFYDAWCAPQYRNDWIYRRRDYRARHIRQWGRNA